jgi:hypothetical protein
MENKIWFVLLVVVGVLYFVAGYMEHRRNYENYDKNRGDRFKANSCK